MLEIVTNVATFGNWKDCYKFMKEENMQSIEVTMTRYCLQEIFGKHNYNLKEIAQMAEILPFNDY